MTFPGIAPKITRCTHRLLLYGVGLVLAGCQMIFGQYQFDDSASGGTDAASSGGSTAMGGASPVGGSFPSGGSLSTGGVASDSCDTPYRCISVGQTDAAQQCTNGVWTTLQTCTNSWLCQPTTGKCDVCAAGEFNCNNGVLNLCNSARTGFDQTTCASPLYCDATVGKCVECAYGQTRCNSTSTNYLDTCDNGTRVWNLQSQNCGSLGCHTVEGSSDYCNVCASSDPPACGTINTPDASTSNSPLLSCVSGKWKSTQCQNGCKPATASTPAACY
jgi:hypothetical protein